MCPVFFPFGSSFFRASSLPSHPRKNRGRTTRPPYVIRYCNPPARFIVVPNQHDNSATEKNIAASPLWPRLSPPRGRCDSGKFCDSARVRIRGPFRGGGRPQPHPKAVPRLRCEHANCPASPARIYMRWPCPRPCVGAWQRWRPAPRLSCAVVRLTFAPPYAFGARVASSRPPAPAFYLCRGR